ncbi:S4 RNA-binding domain-containing protein [Haematococcus lacustris]|uniref:S4 RNA-binding domain-containing protein n=1 Tax=Haematococcus lacustris TaxID=44745 RepID=A0A6A0AFQ7_HAELA|nr:S4 RNA-binding domain-containing protein [Haematococcus lacustris]
MCPTGLTCAGWWAGRRSAGLKLEAALAHFGVDVHGLVCLDSGQSTGGFTDCLLQHGAAHVYGVDVGYGQLADKVRRDERVTALERFNLRYLNPTDLPQQVDLATLDLAFISVLKVIPAVVSVLKPSPAGQLLVLIKPQFEAGPEHVKAGGLVRSAAVHRDVIARVTQGICEAGFECRGVIESPLKGDRSGNTEFLAHFTR